MNAQSIPATLEALSCDLTRQQRIARRAYGLERLRFWNAHTYRQRAWAHGLQPAVEPADMAAHEVNNEMTAEMLSE